MANDTRSIVEGYFTAWTTQRTADAYALLAPDLAFSGPGAKYADAARDFFNRHPGL